MSEVRKYVYNIIELLKQPLITIIITIFMQLHYFSRLSSFASCSCDPNFSLVTGYTLYNATLYMQLLLLMINWTGPPKPSTEVGILEQNMKRMSAYTRPRSILPAKRRAVHDQRVFKVSTGVSSVDYCPQNNVIITGSVDRVIRVWNPYMTL